MRGRAVQAGGQAISAAIRASGDYQADAVRSVAASNLRGAKELQGGLDSIADAAIKFQLNQDRQDMAIRKSTFAIKKAELDQEFERDREYATMPTRYGERLTALREGLINGVPNPAMRQQFDLETSVTAAESMGRVKQKAFEVEKEVNAGALVKRVEETANTAMTEPDPKERTKRLVWARDDIDAAEAKGYLTPKQAEGMRRDLAGHYGVASLRAIKDPEERKYHLQQPVAGREATVSRIIGVESANDPNAKNKRSSATGLGQFTNATWLATVAKHRPDLMQGRSQADVLALRANGDLSREMTGKLYDDNAALFRNKYHIPVTPTNMYMAHFLGVETAAAVIKAPADMPIAGIVGNKAVQANPEMLGGATAGSLLNKIERKMGGSVRGTGSPVDFITEPQRAGLLNEAETEIRAKQTATSALLGEHFERQIIEAKKSGVFDFRDAIDQDPRLSEEKRNTLLRSFDESAKEHRGVVNIKAAFDNPAIPVDQRSPEARKAIDNFFPELAQKVGPVRATEALVERFGTVPTQVYSTLRSSLDSDNPALVGQALEAAHRIKKIKPHAFSGHQGQGKAVAEAADEWDHYRSKLGKTPEQAAAMYIDNHKETNREERSKARQERKKLVKETIPDSEAEADLTKHFAEPWFLGLMPGRPGLESNKEVREALRSTYQELVATELDKGSTEEGAKSAAKTQIARRFGVTKVSGKAVLTHLPPENAPAYAGISNVADRIAGQAVMEIRNATGELVPRSKIHLLPVPGVTWQDTDAGKTPRYQLAWEDKNGVMQVYFDYWSASPVPMRAQAGAEQQTKIEKAVQQNALRRESDTARIEAGTMLGAP